MCCALNASSPACTEGGNRYLHGTSWTCSDGCNSWCVLHLPVVLVVWCTPVSVPHPLPTHCSSCHDGDVASTDAACPPSCVAVSCPVMKCREGQVSAPLFGECCNTCQDCSVRPQFPLWFRMCFEADLLYLCWPCSLPPSLVQSVSCNVQECGENERRVYPDTQCCSECQDCRVR